MITYLTVTLSGYVQNYDFRIERRSLIIGRESRNSEECNVQYEVDTTEERN